MNTISPNNGLLDQLSVQAFSTYLERTGWIRVDHPNNKIMLFEGPPDDEGHPLQLVLPRDQSFDDARVRLAESVGLLSTLLQISPEAVVERIVTDTESAISKHEAVTVVAKNSSPSWVMPPSIEKHFQWKRRRETWPPFLGVAIALLTLVVIIVQGIFINTQTQFMNEQTKIMQRSLEISDKGLLVSQRAYVGIASITADLERKEIQIVLQNIGQVPAKGVKLDVQEKRVVPRVNGEITDSGEPVNERQVGSDVHWEAGEVQLFPGTPMHVLIYLRQLQSEEVAAILSKKEILYIGGTIQYDDGFGNCDRTIFAFRYDSHNKLWIADPLLSKLFKRNGC